MLCFYMFTVQHGTNRKNFHHGSSIHKDFGSVHLHYRYDVKIVSAILWHSPTVSSSKKVINILLKPWTNIPQLIMVYRCTTSNHDASMNYEIINRAILALHSLSHSSLTHHLLLGGFPYEIKCFSGFYMKFNQQ